MSLAFPGVRTRLPFPGRDEARHRLVGFAYRAMGVLLAHRFRHSVDLAGLDNARIVILKPCCLGDVVFSTPLVRELRQALPRARITYATGRHSRPAIEGNPHLDAILDTGPVGSGAYGRHDFLDLVHRLRAGSFDCCFVLERSAVLALAPLLAGIPIRVGIDSGGRGFSLTAAASTKPTRPESELYLDLLRVIGGDPVSGELEYYPANDAVQHVDGLLAAGDIDPRAFVVLHAAGGTNPGMALLRKRWPPESFCQLAERILDRGVDVVLVGASEDQEVAREVVGGLGGTVPHPGPLPEGEGSGRGSAGSAGACPPHVGPSRGQAPALRGAGEEEAIAPRETMRVALPILEAPSTSRKVIGREARLVDLVGQLSLGAVAELARRAVVYVGNDSGPTHLAEAAGAKVVMLFGPSDPIVYGPRVKRSVALSAGFWCSPCFEQGRVAPCANVICMAAIPVERVWRAVARLLEAPVEWR